jgi:hypothetical protein
MNKLYPPYLEARLKEINEADAIEKRRLEQRVKKIKIRFLQGGGTL